jgi:hypothetical protein
MVAPTDSGQNDHKRHSYGLPVVKLRTVDQALTPFAPLACTLQYRTVFAGRSLITV